MWLESTMTQQGMTTFRVLGQSRAGRKRGAAGLIKQIPPVGQTLTSLGVSSRPGFTAPPASFSLKYMVTA